MTAPIQYDRVVPLSPLVRRITQRNPGLFTGPGTNTHLVGRSAVFILDPGEDVGDGHLERIVAAVAGASVHAIIPSHGHPDHWPLAPQLAEALGAPIWFFGTHPGFRTDRSLSDGEILEAGGIRLETLYTPGHCSDHLSFVMAAERAAFPGDVVMGWSTSIIAPPEGNLPEYLESLERLLAVPNLEILYPAHGEAITTPSARIKELYAHRQERTRQTLNALGAGPAQIGDLVKQIYADVDPALHGAAAQSLLAHLLALESEGTIAQSGPAGTPPTPQPIWHLAPPRAERRVPSAECRVPSAERGPLVRPPEPCA